MFARTVLLLFALSEVAVPCCGREPWTQQDLDYFERKIRPLLSQHCYECHSHVADCVHGGLALDSSDSVTRGGDSGPLLVAGDADESLLIKVVSYDGQIQMPPAGKLSDREIDELKRWVNRGAPFPPSHDPPPLSDGIDFERGRQFWSFRPAGVSQSPGVNDGTWVRQRVDAFLLAGIEREGLRPSPRADRATLIRRLSFDLIGLPPTPREIQRFVNDESPDAYERLVDRLLQSPHYGENWARWWLDMARYTDRTASWLYQGSQAHRYRDWVVDALNADMPYDEFVHRQLATDLMPETGPEDLPALGFLSLSPTYWKELKLPCEIIKVIVADEWEERVDVVSRTFLGLTVACARCHDHKYDPISSEDYYALAGIFASCRQVERPMISPSQYEPVRLARQAVAEIEGEIAKLKKEKPPAKEKLAELAAEIARIKASTPRYNTAMANALSEESMYVVRAGETAQQGTRLDYRPGPRDLPAFIRGNPNRPGPVIPRRFLTVLTDQPRPYARNNSGRLELARSITTDAASLAARVIVNRVWLAHFGRGIVDTPSDFGRQGQRPTHPELLDDLAARFIAGGWSLKRLHREIVLSSAWQQVSAVTPQQLRSAPDNRWLARMNRRRLTFEQWRDAMLVASDQLDRAMGGASIDVDQADNRRRTLYSTIHRRDMSPTLMIHDFPDPTQHSPRRTATVTALQGLYALNGPLLTGQAARLAERLRRESPDDDRRRVERVYAWLLGRSPREREIDWGLTFVNAAEPRERAERWQQYLHVLLASNELLFID